MKHICSDWSSLIMSTSIDIYMFLPLFDSDWVWGPYRHLFAGVAVGKWDLHVISTSGLFQTTSLHSCTRPFLIWPLIHSSLRSLIILLSCCTHEGGTGSHFREREKKCVKDMRRWSAAEAPEAVGLLKIILPMGTSVLRKMGEPLLELHSVSVI